MLTINNFEEFPKELCLRDSVTGEPVAARYVQLDKDLCRDQIDKVWWSILSVEKSEKRKEPDYGKLWVDKLGSFRHEHPGYTNAWGIETVDDCILQGAILYSTDSLSMLDITEGAEEAEPATWIGALATAPWNRARFTPSSVRSHNGCGTALLRLAIVHGYFRRRGFRINLCSMDHPDTLQWYENRGFRRCRPEGQPHLLELPEEDAKRLLIPWRLA